MLELAVRAGVSPSDPFTPRDLFVLAAEVEDAKWSHTAQLTAAVVNAMSGRGKAVESDKFNPIRQARLGKRSANEGMSIAEAVKLIKEMDNGVSR